MASCHSSQGSREKSLSTPGVVRALVGRALEDEGLEKMSPSEDQRLSVKRVGVKKK